MGFPTTDTTHSLNGSLQRSFRTSFEISHKNKRKKNSNYEHSWTPLPFAVLFALLLLRTSASHRRLQDDKNASDEEVQSKSILLFFPFSKNETFSTTEPLLIPAVYSGRDQFPICFSSLLKQAKHKIKKKKKPRPSRHTLWSQQKFRQKQSATRSLSAPRTFRLTMPIEEDLKRAEKPN
jgi:hypothetical protein